MKRKKQIKKLVQTLRQFASSIAAKKLKVPKSKRAVFTLYGQVGDIVGRIMIDAGFGYAFKPYHTKTSFDGAPGPRWWSIEDVFEHVTGIRPDCMRLELAIDNAYRGITPKERLEIVSRELRNIADELEQR